MPSAVLDVDLCQTLRERPAPAGYRSAIALVRWRGKPLAQVRLDLSSGWIRPIAVWQAAEVALGETLRAEVLPYLIHWSEPSKPADTDSLACSVVVCTRNRAADLRRCLEALCRSRRECDEILVVDNAPSDETTEEVARTFPVRYEREPRRGLNWARAHGARCATREVVLFVDDDVVVDPHWVQCMAEPFSDPAVAGVTGLIMPMELDTAAQEMFEEYGGFVSHFRRRWFSAANMPPAAAAQIGAGASMGFRRQLATGLRLFDCEMDCGTAARSGGDHYAFYRLLRAGHGMVFNPEAVCWHRHRRTEPELRSTLQGYSVGVYSFLLRCVLTHRDPAAIRIGLAWFFDHHVKSLWRGVRGRPGALPLRFTLDEIRGALSSPRAYWTIRRAERSGNATLGSRI